VINTYSITEPEVRTYKKLSCRRETARRFLSIIEYVAKLIKVTQVKVIRNDTVE